MPAPRVVGSEVKRLEDPRPVRGDAGLVDDFELHRLAPACVVRGAAGAAA